MNDKQLSEIFAKSALYARQGWTTHAFGKKPNGGSAFGNATEVTCRCTTGCLQAAIFPPDVSPDEFLPEYSLYERTCQIIQKKVGRSPIIWNDQHGRTQEEVVQLFETLAQEYA